MTVTAEDPRWELCFQRRAHGGTLMLRPKTVSALKEQGLVVAGDIPDDRLLGDDTFKALTLCAQYLPTDRFTDAEQLMPSMVSAVSDAEIPDNLTNEAWEVLATTAVRPGLSTHDERFVVGMYALTDISAGRMRAQYGDHALVAVAKCLSRVDGLRPSEVYALLNILIWGRRVDVVPPLIPFLHNNLLDRDQLLKLAGILNAELAVRVHDFERKVEFSRLSKLADLANYRGIWHMIPAAIHYGFSETRVSEFVDRLSEAQEVFTDGDTEMTDLVAASVSDGTTVAKILWAARTPELAMNTIVENGIRIVR